MSSNLSKWRKLDHARCKSSLLAFEVAKRIFATERLKEMMSYTYWHELVEALSDEEKRDYLRRIFLKDAPFDPLHNLNDAWSLTENKAIEKVELEREGGSTYACLLTIDNTRFDMWCANTAQEAIVGAVMKAYDAGIRIW